MAKGLSRSAAVWRHALTVAFLPVLSYLGPATAQAMTGSFIVEKVFGVPGLGQHFVNAALNRDVGLILSTVLVFSTMLVAFNLIVDLLHARLDPRVTESV
jgi:oligopeptide transport system permease protein